MATADGQYRESSPGTKDSKGTLPAPQLFDLASDPSEERNLATTNTGKLKELTALLANYRAQAYSRPGWESPR